MFRYTRYLTPIGNGVLSGLTHYSHHFRHRPPRKTSRVLRIFDDFRRHSAHFICHAWFFDGHICNLHRFCLHVVSAVPIFIGCLPSKSRVVGPADMLMTMPALSKCRWKEWSATHVGPHVGTKQEWLREQIGSCGAERRVSQNLSKHIKWERVETEHAPIWGTDSRLISYRIEYYFILQCIFGKCLGICTPAHMMLTTCANWCTFHVSKVSLFHPLWRQGCPKIGWLVVNMDETDQLCPFWSQI